LSEDVCGLRGFRLGTDLEVVGVSRASMDRCGGFWNPTRKGDVSFLVVTCRQKVVGVRRDRFDSALGSDNVVVKEERKTYALTQERADALKSGGWQISVSALSCVSRPLFPLLPGPSVLKVTVSRQDLAPSSLNRGIVHERANRKACRRRRNKPRAL
jgi:hypothetical protein